MKLCKGCQLAGVFLFLICSLTFNLYAADYGGGAGTSKDPYQIWTAEQMNSIGANVADWDKCFALMADVNMADYQDKKYLIIGNDVNMFTGTFEGNGHIISNVNFISSSRNFCVGVFGYTYGATIQNLGVEDVNVGGTVLQIVGGLIGIQYEGTISNCYSRGSLNVNGGAMYVGGLVGWAKNANIENCYSDVNVVLTSTTSYGMGGGLVGAQHEGGSISRCCATGSVYATAPGYAFVGGLVGQQKYGGIYNCYSRGDVVAVNTESGTYAGAYAGGLLGHQESTDSKYIYYSYSTGSASATGVDVVYTGGFIGYRTSCTCKNCFWDTTTSGLSSAVGTGLTKSITGKTTDVMQTLLTFTSAGWDFSVLDEDEADWMMPGNDYPKLIWQAVAAPEFSPEEGSYSGKQMITIAAPTPDSTIYYTADGSEPDEDSKTIDSGSSIFVGESLTLKAKAYKNNFEPSGTTSADYQINTICPAYDLSGDCIVNFVDFAIMAEWWMNDCGINNKYCGYAELDASGNINFDDIAEMSAEWLSWSTIADHVTSIRTSIIWDYASPSLSDDSTYDFDMQIVTDTNVSGIAVTTPAGNSFTFSDGDLYGSDGDRIITLLGTEDNLYTWRYNYKFYDSTSLSAYGDGLYTLTVYYTDGSSQQTTAWFGVPDSAEFISQPIQEPVFTSFSDGGTIESPVAFQWSACSDPNAEQIRVLYVLYGNDESVYNGEYVVDKSAVLLDAAVEMVPGTCNPSLSFETFYQSQNDDGITIEAGKLSQSSYSITIYESE